MTFKRRLETLAKYVEEIQKIEEERKKYSMDRAYRKKDLDTLRELLSENVCKIFREHIQFDMKTREEILNHIEQVYMNYCSTFLDLYAPKEAVREYESHLADKVGFLLDEVTRLQEEKAELEKQLKEGVNKG